MTNGGGQSTPQQVVPVLGYQTYTAILPPPTDGYRTLPQPFPRWLAWWNFFALTVWALIKALAVSGMRPPYAPTWFLFLIFAFLLIMVAQLPLTVYLISCTIRRRGNRMAASVACIFCVLWWLVVLIGILVKHLA